MLTNITPMQRYELLWRTVSCVSMQFTSLIFMLRYKNWFSLIDMGFIYHNQHWGFLLDGPYFTCISPWWKEQVKIMQDPRQWLAKCGIHKIVYFYNYKWCISLHGTYILRKQIYCKSSPWTSHTIVVHTVWLRHFSNLCSHQI